MNLVITAFILVINQNIATILRGDILTDLTLTAISSPYYVIEDITIKATASLIIENNVRLYLNKSHKIEVLGSIISGCNDINTQLLTYRGVNSSNYVYIYGGQGILLEQGGLGHFCNTKFEAMYYGIVGDGELYNDNKYIVDNCEFNNVVNAIQFEPHKHQIAKHYVTDSIFTNIVDDSLYKGGVVVDNCKFDTFRELFDNTADDFIIRNSEILNGQRMCLQMYGSPQNQIYNNIIENCTSHGIQILPLVTGTFTISNNTISGCGQYAIHSTHDGQITIIDNVFTKNAQVIYADDTQLIIANNTFRETTNVALNMVLDINDDVIVQDNLFIDNGGDLCTNMLYIDGGAAKVHIEQNRFGNNQCNRLFHVNNNQFTTISDNTFIENSLLSTSSSSNMLIYISSSNTKIINSSIINNHFHDNQHQDILYFSGIDIINVDSNFFNISATAAFSNYIFINDGKSADMRVTGNYFHGQNSNSYNFVYLENTPYDIFAINNYFGDVLSINNISSRMHDYCDNSQLGQIQFCPFNISHQIDSHLTNCDCNSINLCTADRTCIATTSQPSTSTTSRPTSPSTFGLTSTSTFIPTSKPTPKPTDIPTTKQPTTKETKPSTTSTSTTVSTNTVSVPSSSSPTSSKSSQKLITNNPTLSPTFRPTTAIPTKQPTIFYGADIHIRFTNQRLTANQTKSIMPILQRVINDIINDTVPHNCSIHMNVITDNQSSFNATLTVCDQPTERNLRYLFESADGMKQFEAEIITNIQQEINDTNINQTEIVMMIEGIKITNHDIFATTPTFIYSVKKQRKTSDHFIYIIIVTGVLVTAFFIGIIQYCRYERNQLKDQESLVRDRQNRRDRRDRMRRRGKLSMDKDDGMTVRMIRIHSHNPLADRLESEPGQSVNMGMAVKRIESSHISHPERMHELRFYDHVDEKGVGGRGIMGESNMDLTEKIEEIDHDDISRIDQNHEEVGIMRDTRDNFEMDSSDETEYRENTKGFIGHLSEISIINDSEHELCRDTDNEEMVIEGDDRQITRNMDIACPLTIR